MKTKMKKEVILFLFLLLNFAVLGQTIMFDDFTYSGVDDAQLSSFNKWSIVNGTDGPPEGAIYSRNNISFITDPGNPSNKLMTLSTTVNGATKATTHSRIETSGFEYFEGTYSSRVFLTDNPFTYKDANIQTFFTIVSSSLSGDGSRYSELDVIEYMAADKWGISQDNPVAYVTSWNRYIAEPWQAWKRYFSYKNSYAGWHTFTVSCTDKVNIKYWIDDTYLGSMATTDNDGSSVYPRSNMQVAFANWIWNNVVGSSTANRTTTMQVDWTLYYKNQELTPQQINAQVATYRSQGLQRRNLAGQTFVTNTCTLPAQPGLISGNTTAISGSSQSYSIASVANATSYTWTLPSGWLGSSSSTSITTTAGSAGGTITVKATNACGSSAATTLNVSVVENSPNLALNKLTTVSSIEAGGLEGNKAVDGSTSTRWASSYSDPQYLYVDLGANYSVNRVKVSWEAAYGKDYQIQISSDASSWTPLKTVSGNTTLSNDWTGLAGTGRYVRIYGTARGTAWGYSIFELEVYGTLSCTVPAQPGAISGNASVTSGSSQTYAIAAVANATSYTWTLPSGWSGTSTSSSIATTVGNAGGNISVRANNACGTSAATNFSVTLLCTVPAQPAIITGTTTVASGTSQAYSIAAVAGATSYSWTLPSGWSGTSTSTAITTVVGSAGGTISVKANNSCGSGAASTLAVSVTGTTFTSRIEAEDYLYMDGVQKETCSEGGLNVGYFDAGDWMSYNINIPVAGTYKISYRVASIYSGKTMRLEKDGGATLLGTVAIPNTGNWQNWVTVSQNVTMPAGSYAIGLTTYTGGLNINWLEITNNLAARSGSLTDSEEIKETLSVYPNPVEATMNIISTVSLTGATISVIDGMGIEVFSMKNMNTDNLDISPLKAGIYTLKVISADHKTYSYKFMKQ